MLFSLSEHKLPIGVTAVGLLVATGLAVAPVLMAESATDVLAAKNATEIENLTATLKKQSEALEQQLNAQSPDISAKLKNLDAQVIVLNKAVKKIFKNSQDRAAATEASLSELTNGPRLVNLEKAVKQLHIRQQKNRDSQQTTQPASKPVATIKTAKPESAIASNEKKRDYKNIFTRVESLENTVQQLSSMLNNASNTNTGLASDGVALKKTNNSKPNEISLVSVDAENRVKDLELLVKQLQRRQQSANSTDSLAFAQSNPESATEIRIKRMERIIARMGRRLDSVESSDPSQDDMIDQLYKIQDNIDQMLDQLAR